MKQNKRNRVLTTKKKNTPKKRVAHKATRSKTVKKTEVKKKKISPEALFPIWRTKNGREIPVNEMTSNHLLNTPAHINRRKRVFREHLERLDMYSRAMDAVLMSRNVWVRPSEEPIAPIEDQYGNKYLKNTGSFRHSIPNPIDDPHGYLRWARNNPFP